MGLESASAQLSGPARLGNTTTSLHGNGVRVELEYATVDLWYILFGGGGGKVLIIGGRTKRELFTWAQRYRSREF